MMKESALQTTFPPEMLSLLEKNDFTILSTDEQDGEYVSELETYSPAGEDVIITLWHDGTTEDFIHSFYQYAIDFDPDEHAEMWIESRGKNGVPSSIRDMIADADDIDDTLNDMAEKLYAWRRERMKKIGQMLENYSIYEVIDKMIEAGYEDQILNYMEATKDE